jgi:hypothetical protein
VLWERSLIATPVFIVIKKLSRAILYFNIPK